MRIEARCDPVDLLIGLSVGAQVVAVAAAAQGGAGSPRIGRLMLVSPTVDAAARSMPALLGRWIAGGRVERPRLFREQLPDWRRAGSRRLLTVARSALAVDLERLLAVVDVPVDVVHAEHDKITSHAYAAALASGDRRGLTIVPGATHSWPYSDVGCFADLVERVLG
jgi:pimeloyl-ACP methyl ester carboxylesterase